MPHRFQTLNQPLTRVLSHGLNSEPDRLVLVQVDRSQGFEHAFFVDGIDRLTHRNTYGAGNSNGCQLLKTDVTKNRDKLVHRLSTHNSKLDLLCALPSKIQLRDLLLQIFPVDHRDDVDPLTLDVVDRSIIANSYPVNLLPPVALKFSDLLAWRKEGILLQDLQIVQNLRSPLSGEFPQLARGALAYVYCEVAFKARGQSPPEVVSSSPFRLAQHL